MMDLQKSYFDLDEKRRSILEMVNREPEWAANRIQEGEKAERKLAVVMRILKERKARFYQVTCADAQRRKN